MTELRSREPITLPEIAAMKAAGTKIVMVTAYDHPSARLASDAGIDIVLVGDSAGNNVLGYPSTVPVTMDEALMLTAAVARAKPRALDRRRHAVRLVPGLRRRCGRQRRPPGQGRSRCGQARGRRTDAPPRRAPSSGAGSRSWATSA